MATPKVEQFFVFFEAPHIKDANSIGQQRYLQAFAMPYFFPQYVLLREEIDHLVPEEPASTDVFQECEYLDPFSLSVHVPEAEIPVCAWHMSIGKKLL